VARSGRCFGAKASTAPSSQRGVPSAKIGLGGVADGAAESAPADDITRDDQIAISEIGDWRGQVDAAGSDAEVVVQRVAAPQSVLSVQFKRRQEHRTKHQRKKNVDDAHGSSILATSDQAICNFSSAMVVPAFSVAGQPPPGESGQ
jgi:hypothetical protein